MRIKAAAVWVTFVGCVAGAPACAQDLGPQFKKFGDGIYVYVGKNFKSNTGIILTQDGVVLIDSGHEPTDSRAVLEADCFRPPHSCPTRSTSSVPSSISPTSWPPER